MSLVARIGPLSSSPSVTYVGIAGLSLTACFGIFKLLKDLWRFRRAEAWKNAELSSLRRLLTAARSDAETKEEALTALRSELDRVKPHLEELGQLFERARRHNEILVAQVKHQTEAAQLLKEEAQQFKTKHIQTVQLLEARTLELKGAEAFLTKADTLSGADIIGMLNSLNSEIYQIAALVAESFEFKEKRRKRGWREVRDVIEPGKKVESAGEDVESGTGEQEENAGEEAEKEAEMLEVYASATEILGPRMVELLKKSEHHEDPTIIQIAFQAGMSAYTNWIVTSWYFDDPEEEHLLSEIYTRVREAGKCLKIVFSIATMLTLHRGAGRLGSMASSDTSSCPANDRPRTRSRHVLHRRLRQHSPNSRRHRNATRPTREHCNSFRRQNRYYCERCPKTSQGNWGGGYFVRFRGLACYTGHGV